MKTSTQMLSCKICEFFRNTFYRTPPVAVSEQTQEISVVHLAKGFFGHLDWWLSNIMLNLSTESSSDISLLFKLKYAAISLILWTVNSHVIRTHFVYMNTQKWLVQKESDIYSERKSWNDFYFSVESTFQENSSKQNFYAFAKAKKRCCRDIPLTFRLV